MIGVWVSHVYGSTLFGATGRNSRLPPTWKCLKLGDCNLLIRHQSHQVGSRNRPSRIGCSPEARKSIQFCSPGREVCIRSLLVVSMVIKMVQRCRAGLMRGDDRSGWRVTMSDCRSIAGVTLGGRHVKCAANGNP